MKYLTKEVKIALTAILAIIILFAGINFLKGIIILSNDNSYKMQFKSIDGLGDSSPIYADGYKVGVVRGIEYSYDHSKDITVFADINPDLRIPKGSTAEIVSDLMGNMQINLLLANNPRERIEPGDVIMGVVNDGALGELKELVPYVKNMVPKLDSILTSLNALLADPALRQSLHNVEAITENLKTSTNSLNTLMADANRRMPGIMESADKTLANTEKLTGNLAEVDVAATMAEVNATLAEVKRFTASLNSDNGTLGRFMHDPSLYNNLNNTMRDADSLMIDLKSHPKRYVHFSVFGKKDK